MFDPFVEGTRLKDVGKTECAFEELGKRSAKQLVVVGDDGCIAHQIDPWGNAARES